MSYLRQLRAVLWKDLLVELRTRERTISMAAFTVLVAFLFNHALDPARVDVQDVAAGLLWMTILFAGTLGIGRTFQLESEEGAFHGVLLSPTPKDAIYLGKVGANFVILLIITLLALAVFGLFFHLHYGDRPGTLLLVMALGILGFVALGTLFSAISTGTSMGDTLLPILLFPLLVPMIVFGVSATDRLLAGRPMEEIAGHLRILAAFALVAVAAGSVLFRFVVEE